MSVGSENIEELTIKVKLATKQKLSKEREAYILRNLERSLNENLMMTKNENKLMKEQLQDLKCEISKAHHQISMIEVCKTSEKVKIESHIHETMKYEKDFEYLFQKEKEKVEQHNKEIRVKEAEHQDIKMQLQLEVQLKTEQQLQDALDIEAETETLEKECAVLKKRNTAIMLKLRRKLIDTEDARRKLKLIQRSEL